MDFEKKADAEALLQFQDFSSTTTPTPSGNKPPPYEQTHNFSNFPSAHVDIEEENDPLDPSAASAAQKNIPSMLSWAYYQRYFDVDTAQVKERLMWSFLPRPSRDTLTHYIRPTPDLYGPFWVCVTLVFCIAIMGNVADYMQFGGEGQHWRYDFRKVSISASTIFSYALLVPLGLWGFLWWRKGQDGKSVLGLMELVSLYGYSLAIYIPISILWAVPFAWIQWILVIVGASLSGAVLVLSLWPPLSSIQKSIGVIIIAIIVALHFLLAAGLQLYFFRYSKDILVVSGTGNGGSSPAQLQGIEPNHQHPFGGVTELQDLNLVLEEDPRQSLDPSSTSLKESAKPFTHPVTSDTTTSAAFVSTQAGIKTSPETEASAVETQTENETTKQPLSVLKQIDTTQEER